MVMTKDEMQPIITELLNLPGVAEKLREPGTLGEFFHSEEGQKLLAAMDDVIPPVVKKTHE